MRVSVVREEYDGGHIGLYVDGKLKLSNYYEEFTVEEVLVACGIPFDFFTLAMDGRPDPDLGQALATDENIRAETQAQRAAENH